MSDPVAVTLPDGTVRAWACGRCLSVGLASHRMGPLLIALSRRSAESCCLCVDCRAVPATPLEEGNPWRCPRCAALIDLAISGAPRGEADAAHDATADECDECDGRGVCSGCHGTGEATP